MYTKTIKLFLRLEKNNTGNPYTGNVRYKSPGNHMDESTGLLHEDTYLAYINRI